EDRLIDCDVALARMFGYSRKELRGKSLRSLFKKDLTSASLSMYPNLLVHKGLKKDGTSFFFELIEHPYYEENNIVRVAIIRDLTEQVYQDKKIKQLAFFDELTGLPNL